MAEPMTETLQQTLRNELTATRQLGVREAQAITTRLGADDPLVALAGEGFAALEEWEQELLLSPLFTPDQETRARVESAIPLEGMAVEAVAGLARELEAMELRAPLEFGDQVGESPVPAVVIERFLRLLYLGQTIYPPVLEVLSSLGLAPEEGWAARAVIRRLLWRDAPLRSLLLECLERMGRRGSYSLVKLQFLEELFSSSRPTSVEEVIRHLENLVESYRVDPERPVFNEHLAKKQEVAIRSSMSGPEAKARRLAMAGDLLKDLGGDGPG